MDPFGTGARARCKALEEALAVERARNAELTRQIIALSDAKAYRVLVPSEVSVGKRAGFAEKPVIRHPMDADQLARTVADAREMWRKEA